VPRSILVVDDHEVIRRQLRLLFDSDPELTVCGEAIHGVDAIEKAQRLSPDLILLDLAMPEMNGLEAASALRYMLPDVPIFLLTAHYSRELELAAFASGVCAVFSKHDDLDSLVARARLELKLAHNANSESSTQEGS
jgi:DNA-binding NarL/FixJ family response regulator